MKLLKILVSILVIYVISCIFTILFRPNDWYWIVASLSIGLIITAGPLLRVIVKPKDQEELDPWVESAKPEELNPSIESTKPAKGISCSHCGYEIPHKKLYCDNCGEKVGK